MDTYSSNGLNYAPYQSKRNSKRLSGGEVTHAESQPKRKDTAGQCTDVRPVVVSAPVRALQPPPDSALPPSQSRPIIAGLSNSSATLRRLSPKSPVPKPASPFPLRSTNPLYLPKVSTRPAVLVLDSASSDSNVSEQKPVAPSLPPTEPIPRVSVTSPGPLAQSIASGSRKLSPANSPLASMIALPEDNTAPHGSVSPILPPASPFVPSSSERKTPATASSRLNTSFTPRSSSSSPTPAPTLSASGTFPTQKAPYRKGFQPKGAYRDLTDDFLAARNCRANAQRGEERRIERRLEKLINLHFPPESSVPQPNARPPPTARRSSSLFDFPEFGGRSPGNLLRSVVEPKPGTLAALRAAEQIITPWQEDAAAAQCPHCNTSFHPITNRKHHCRLCGRVVCALPPKKPNRLRPCSLLVTADRQTGRIVAVPDAIAYGVTRRPSSNITSSSTSLNGHAEVSPKTFRVCKECNAVISRKELYYEANTPTAFTRLHNLLLHIESDIEIHLVSLEAVFPSAHLQPLNHELQLLRKQLTGLFSDYDAVAKRIRSLPFDSQSVKTLENAVTGQERVQQAVWARALNFMQMHVGLLQRIPTPSRKCSKPGPQSQGLENEKMAMDEDVATAHSLQPLLEQEALLESFIQEANAQRKFEDVKSLKVNLAEIRGEIEKIVAASNLGNH